MILHFYTFRGIIPGTVNLDSCTIGNNFIIRKRLNKGKKFILAGLRHGSVGSIEIKIFPK
jgi:hypothetical protein